MPFAASVMKRRPSMDTSCAVPAPPGRPVSAALALALALALGAGGAAAQTCNSARTVTAAAPFSTFNSNTVLTRSLANVRIETTGGTNAFAVHAYHGGNGNIDFDIKDFTLSTSGAASGAVLVSRPFRVARNTGNIDSNVQCGSITTSGNGSYGMEVTNQDSGNVAAIVKKVDITTSGDGGAGMVVYRAQNSMRDYSTQGVRDGEVTVEVEDSTIATSGANAHAVWISQDRVRTGGGAGAIDADLTNVAISTSGAGAIGVHVFHRHTTGAVALDVTGGSVSTSGANGHAVLVDRAGTGDGAIALTGVAIAAEGRGAGGVRAFHRGSGSVTLTVGAGTKVEAPFAIGVDARLTDGANAAGRLVVTHGGTVEARDAGVVAWAARRSGHTSGAGANEADDAARTEAMIHVTSSGNVTVGEGVRDAFIRAAIAGEDGMLSAGEKAVFDAIVAGDSDALTTALAALPATDYDAAWQARASALLTSRGHEPTDAGTLANRAAEEIMGLTRSGIRALALSHEAIAGHVRNGDGGGALSAAERTVLEAALTGGGLEAALTALSATYTTAWKDGVRQRALAYNAGDIQVDVDGGTITAEGDGVDARYALTHDDNGAIAVAVAAGATVSGGRHGVHVGGAGLVTGNTDLRDQTVTVDGAVMGGTGAGVHLAGGGTVTVGSTGRVGATSGDGILSEGAGDLVATVHGTVAGNIRARGGGDLDATVAGTVEGDLRAEDGGALTVDVQEGGAVTGTVHDPAGPLTVSGSIGRLLYTSGGTVTVAATGRITGVEGETDGIRSDAGDLSVTVAGTVAGDVRAEGGDLTFASLAGSGVTGTVHDPAGPLTVHGSIGRLLYASGGTVTVAAMGRITGVEREETDGIHSAGGDLSVTVAGTVTGDLRAPSGGALTLAVMEGGAVTGTVHDLAGPLTVAGSIGRLLYSNGGAVTVAGTGRLTGVQVEGRREAIRSQAGDLAVTVAGRVTGDVVEEGAGDLSAAISGTVVGDVFGRGTGEHTVTVSRGGTVSGTIHLAASTVTVDGTAGRVQFDNGGTVTVGSTGKLTGVEGGTEAIRSEAGDLTLTLAGMITGGVRGLGAGDMSATVAGTVRGDIVEEGAGDLSATISGTVEGDIRALGGGTLTVDVQEGGAVTGTVHDPAGPLTVVGSIGRLLYGNGGVVSVAGAGRLTGVQIEGRREAIRSEAGALAVTVARMAKVEGDVRALGGGNLAATVSGTVEGDLRAEGGGTLTVDVKEDGVVTGTVHDPAGALTVVGSIGRVLYASGGTVSVAGTGRITGVEGDAIRSDAGGLAVTVAQMATVEGDIRALGGGNLDATVSGTVDGDLRTVGGGALTVDVKEGGAVTGTFHGAAGPLTVHGSIGRLLYSNGGAVTVSGTGRITGVEGDAIRSDAGDLAVTVAQMMTVEGDIRARGGGDLDATVSGTVEGDLRAEGGGVLTVDVKEGGTVTGTVHDPAGALTIHGSIGRLLYSHGGTVAVSGTGQITGVEVEGVREAIHSQAGDLKVTLHARADETLPETVRRLAGGIRASKSLEFCYRAAGRSADAECVIADGTAPPGALNVPQGAFDVELRYEDGVYRVGGDYAPRARMYEALPSALLGMNGLMRFEERMAAPRSEEGGWARVETLRGKWKADASTTGGLGYDHRRHGLRVGVDVAVGEDGLFGASLHHRRGTADVSNGGEVKLSGTGGGVSGTWRRDDVYVDLQAEATWYGTDFTSPRHGVLKRDVSALGHALGVEAGRRFAVDAVAGGVVLTPRAGLVHSKVSVNDFSDTVGSRVSVEDGRSLKGRAGVSVEAGRAGRGAPGSRVFGSVDVEHEFSDERKVRVSGTELRPVAEATWLRFGLNGSHASDDGRWTFAGGVSYAMSGDSHEFGGGLSLGMRF